MSMYREAAPGPVLLVAFNGQVFGVDPLTGAVKWEHSIGGNCIRLVVTDTAVYAFSINRTLARIAYPGGELLWRVEVEGDTILLEGERLYLGRFGVVSCHSTEGGQLLWKNRFEGKGMGEVALGFPGNQAQPDRTG